MDGTNSKDTTDPEQTAEWDHQAAPAEAETSQYSGGAETEFAGAAVQGGVPQLNKQFGGYRIEKQLGRGGMGAVYLAHDRKLDRPAALKVPFLDKGQSSEVASRFLREARAAATLDHPNICPVYEVGEIEGLQYLAMAYVGGKPLSKYIATGKALPPQQVAAVIRKMAIALQEAHEKGVIHRDLKPANVMVNQRKEPVIMDFGLAQRPSEVESRLTQTGMILGTPAYMSPEQIRAGGADMGPEVDIYSLGVMFYELLTGQLPFTGTPHSVIAQVLTDTPLTPRQRRPELDEQVSAICMKAMAKDGTQRYATMKELAADLRSYIRGEAPAGSSLLAATTPPAIGTLPPVALAVPLAAPPVAPAAPPQAGDTMMVKQLFDDISLNEPAAASTISKVRSRRSNDTYVVWVCAGVAAVLAAGVGLVAITSLRSPEVATAQVDATRTESNRLNAVLEREAEHSKRRAANETTPDDVPQPESDLPGFTVDDLIEATTNNESPSTPAATPALPTGPASPPPAPIEPVKPTTEPLPSTTPDPKPMPAAVSETMPKPAPDSAPKPANKKPVEAKSPITIDGKDTEWRTLVTVPDIRGDATGGDASRDIIRTCVLYTYDDLYVLIETADKPADRGFWLNIDVSADGKEDIQVTILPDGQFFVAAFTAQNDQRRGTGAKCSIGDVVEMQLPIAFLANALPVTAPYLRGRNSPERIGVIAFTADPPDRPFVDYGEPMITNRRVRLPR